MKKILLLLIILFTAFSCSNPKTETDSTKDNLKGKVKTLNNDLLDYNLKGRVKEYSAIKYKAKDSFGIVLKDGIHKNEYSSLSDYEVTISFNKEGYIITETKYNDGIMSSKENIIRDSLYRKIESNNFNSKSKFSGKTLFKYNGNGVISEMNYYNNKGEVETKRIYTYEENKMIRTTSNSDGQTYWSHIYTYNNKGEEIGLKFLDYREQKYNYTNIYTYDSKGKIKIDINKSSPILGFDDVKWETKYNKYGDISDKLHNDNPFEKYEYKYDKYNNWITKIEYSNGFPRYIIERKIQYY